ncbi:MAG: hypothetical protein IPN87_14485 [Saprospiraceae bacterium]|nr:hypothetical protein [Candidatus Brachybacter algidus]
MEPSVTLEVELTITKGRGYVAADEQPDRENIIGVIPIDSIYTPVKNVAYQVSNTRVGQRTDYENLPLKLRPMVLSIRKMQKKLHVSLIQHLMLITMRISIR